MDIISPNKLIKKRVRSVFSGPIVTIIRCCTLQVKNRPSYLCQGSLLLAGGPIVLLNKARSYKTSYPRIS